MFGVHILYEILHENIVQIYIILLLYISCLISVIIVHRFKLSSTSSNEVIRQVGEIIAFRFLVA